MADSYARSLISSAQLNRARSKIVYRIVLTVVIVIFTLVFIGPLYFLFTDGLKSTQEAIAAPPTLYPHHIHPSSYTRAWGEFSLGRLLLNTLYYAFGALAFQLVFDVAAAYSLSRLRPVLGNVILALMLATLMIPATVLIVPHYITVAHLPIVHINLIGSPCRDLAAVAWPTGSTSSCSSGSSTRSRPSCIEAAADRRRVARCASLRSIIIPISRPILAVVSIFSLVAVWKDFLWPLLVEGGFNPTQGDAQRRHLARRPRPRRRTWCIAASAIAAMPTIIFFLIFQRNILAGLTAGGLKG